MAGVSKALLLLLATLCGMQAMRGRNSRNDFNSLSSSLGDALNDMTPGGSFDVDSLLSAIRENSPGQSGADGFRRGQASARRFLGSGDRKVRGDRREQNSRSILGGPINNEFLNDNDVVETALDSEAQAARFVEVTGNSVSQNLDANGEPLNRATAQVAAKITKDKKCVFDRANRDDCSSEFRESTGRCTNVVTGRKTWGMAGTPFFRLLPNKYEDGLSETRKTEFSSRRPLKSARLVSTVVTDTRVVLNSDGVSAQIMQWGQFMAHDFSLIGEIEKDVACCPDLIAKSRNGENSKPSPELLEEIRSEVKRLRGDICIPIEHTGDPVFGEFICMELTRSKPAPKHDCSFGPRQPMNLITHVIDASAVYGSSQKETRALRSMVDGMMKVQVVNGATLPPPKEPGCVRAQNANSCPFLGGDGRINVTPNLISMHTLFLNVHNNIAGRLKALNSRWNDERLFQETRRIVSAIQTNIHYYEYLPIVIGQSVHRRHGLNSYKGLDTSVNPSALNEMAAAAFRYGHSLIDGFISLEKDDGTSAFENLRPLFFDSDTIYDGGIKQCIKGLIKDQPWRSDNHFPTQIRNGLFDKDRDLVSINIQRGRDHGFDSYLNYRRHYGLSIPRSWNDLTTHSAEVRDKLKTMYATVEDMELYPAGVTEIPRGGAHVGELFGNIIGDGFSRLRNGDRFFFENPEAGLSPQQIAAIKTYTFSQLLCEGSGIDKAPKKGFFRTTASGNSEVNCGTIPALNLNLWKEQEQDNGKKCAWKITDVSKCCFGKKTIKRKCENDGPNCRNCRGPKNLEQNCSCAPTDFQCYVDSFSCDDSFSRFLPENMCTNFNWRTGKFEC